MASETIPASDIKSPEYQTVIDFHLKHLTSHTIQMLLIRGLDIAYVFPPQTENESIGK